MPSGMKFAANNTYSTESSLGFSNTWYVLAFENAVYRDAYINNSSDLAARAITKKEISQYVDRPKPFSGARRAVFATFPNKPIPGLIGEVCVGFTEHMFFLRDL